MMKVYLQRGLRLALFAAIAMPTSLMANKTTYYSSKFTGKTPEAIGYTAIDANGDGTTWTTRETTLSFRNLDGVKLDSYVEYTPIQIEDKDNDDWFITPGISFEAGKTYNVTLITAKWAFAEIPGSYEVKLGTDKKADSMTETLIAKDDSGFPEFGGNSLWTKKFVITVPTTGDYYIGIHAIGKPGQKFGFAELCIEKGVGVTTPEAVSNLTLTPDPTGAKKVTISFTTPSKAKDGSPLSALSKVEIRRDGELLKPIDNPAVNTKIIETDAVAVNGIYTYSVVAYTADGGGDSVSATTFIGINTPASVSDVTVINTGARKAHLEWKAPTIDKDGYPMVPGAVSYDIKRTPLYSSEGVVIAEDQKTTEFDDELPLPTEEDENATAQQFYTYSIIAKSVQGQAVAVDAVPVPLGEPYAVPYLESFPSGRASNIFTSTALKGNSYWSQTRDFEDVPSADGDNGMVYLNGQIGGASALYSGLIDLGTMTAPTLSYYTYNIAGADPKDNQIQVTVTSTDGLTKAFDLYAPGMYWQKTLLRLDDFAGKTIRLTFTGYRNNNTELHLDAIAISNIYHNDLKAAAIDLPEKVKSDEPFDVTASFVNFGSNPSGDYTVELYCNDVKVDSYNGKDLEVGAYDRVVFNRVHGITDPEKATYYAKVIYAADEDPENNETEKKTTVIRKNTYPVVSDLKGEKEGGKVILSWSEPDTSKAQPYETLENFDSYPAWSTEIGDWVLVDCDKATIAGFSEQTMPGIPDYSEQSWWIFDNSHEDFNNGSFDTLSGHQFLASMVSGIKGEGYVQNDDWAISPELYGGPQTVTVSARSYYLDGSLNESFEVLYSTGSVDPNDFVSVAKFEDIPVEYAAYQVELPDGAKRFAIRNISFGKYVLMVDDVTYTPVGDPAAFSINGYNVYRDGIKINDAPVEENEFEDVVGSDTDHDYTVTVLYSAGESRFSNVFNPEKGGIYGIEADNAPVEYYDLQGIRVIHPAKGQPCIMRRGCETRKVIIR